MILLPEWYGNKNRTLTKPSCQVRRLSKLKPACLIYLYSFLCSATRYVPSFVEAWLCYAHICTSLPLLSLPWPTPSGIVLNRSRQSPGNVIVSHADSNVWCPDGFRQWRISFVSAWLPDYPCQGCRSSHLFFIIKTTCRGCAWFGWDTQVFIQAIGTRDVRSKWVSKYAFDLEWSSLSASTKTGEQQVTGSVPVLESASCIWMHKSNIYFEAIQLRKQLSSLFDWQKLLVHKRIHLILYFFSVVKK